MKFYYFRISYIFIWKTIVWFFYSTDTLHIRTQCHIFILTLSNIISPETLKLQAASCRNILVSERDFYVIWRNCLYFAWRISGYFELKFGIFFLLFFKGKMAYLKIQFRIWINITQYDFRNTTVISR